MSIVDSGLTSFPILVSSSLYRNRWNRRELVIIDVIWQYCFRISDVSIK